MSWYKTGTITVNNGSAAITGSGTAWIANAANGEAIYLPDGKFYEINSVNSDTSITLAGNYTGTSLSGQSYTILPSQSFIRDLAAQAAALINSYASIANAAGAGKFGDGTLGAPGISFVNDTNTGIRRTADGTFALVANGVDVATIGPGGMTLVTPNIGAATGTSLALSGTLTAGASQFTSTTNPLTVAATDASSLYTTYKYNTSTVVGYVGNGNGIVTGSGSGNFGIRAEGDLILAAGGAVAAGRLSAAGNLGINVNPVNAWGKLQLSGSAGSPLIAAYDSTASKIGYSMQSSGGTPGQVSHYATYYGTGHDAWHAWYVTRSSGVQAVAMSVDPTVDDNGWNSAATGLRVGKTTATGRSISVPGTVNVGGADYAEYVRKAVECGQVIKGGLLGFDAAGMITDKWSATFSGFGIKSTNPNMVGGDVWGSPDQVGECPTEPTSTPPAYAGRADPGEAPVAPQLVLPAEPARQDGESDETFAVFIAAWQRQCADIQAAFANATEQYHQAVADWETAGAQYRIDQQVHAARVATAEAVHAALMEAYLQHKAVFEDRLEQARQSVDRVAFSGIVPVNVRGAQPGDYIVAAEGPDDTIIGVVVTKADIAADMAHYLDAVGRVRRVLDDGRAEVAVIVH